jgi:tetratricopeptide (TPR) repeat protein
MTQAAALAAKERGSELYLNGDYSGAVAAFTEAARLAPSTDAQAHVYHSNRCAAYLQLGQVEEALKDAERCTRIAPKWAKVRVQR